MLLRAYPNIYYRTRKARESTEIEQENRSRERAGYPFRVFRAFRGSLATLLQFMIQPKKPK